ncbi:MAG: kinetochore-associated Ndc80 complex subunit ndc80 [Claussenomyces sp. TS43310]|nr:MAG: kinetochore-associated Ndc80 complex subunit ndc80 [Claussenomyces sp. TS43310]
MSLDQGSFSVRRAPRETLGGISYNSSIPQPASAMKRSNSISGQNNAPFTASHVRSISGSRASLAPSRPNQPQFQRSSSGTNLAEMALSSVKRSSFQNASGRKSFAPGATGRTSGESSERRSSVFRARSSTNGPMGHQSFFQQAPQPAGVPRDPRPLKDRTYQTKIGQELLDYLTNYNFEMEMKHMLSQNTIRSPTQKDFNYMFQWLYHRIDPSYRFLKNIDQEVPPILKQLRYPFEKSITKSQIAAVGGQNWSTFLGLLHWMMQLAQMLDGYGAHQYDDACLESGVDVGGDKIIFGFLSRAYRDWLIMDEDADDDDQDKVLAPHVEAMAREFENSNSKYLGEMKILEAGHERLKRDIEEVEKSTPDIAKLDNFFKTMEDDAVKFEGFNEKMCQRCEKHETRVRFLGEEIEKVMTELKEADEEKTNLQRSVDEQGISMQDIDRMNTERDRLSKGIESTTTRLEEAKRKVTEKELEASAKLEDLERLIEKFNSLGYQIGLIPATAPNAKGKNYELQIIVNEGPNFSASQMGFSQHAGNADSDRLLADPVTGYQPHQILSLDLRGQAKSAFLSLRKEITDRLNAAAELRLKNSDLLDGIKEAIEDKRSEVDTLEHRMRAAREEFEKTKEVITTQKLASDTQIEKMEKELAKMRAGLTESVQLMEQREMNTNIEYEQLTLRANALREELHTEVERMLNDIIKFKVHIQKNLEDYEGFVVDEAEQELNIGGEENDTHAVDME